jgi:hypothetical protein
MLNSETWADKRKKEEEEEESNQAVKHRLGQ